MQIITTSCFMRVCVTCIQYLICQNNNKNNICLNKKATNRNILPYTYELKHMKNISKFICIYIHHFAKRRCVHRCLEKRILIYEKSLSNRNPVRLFTQNEHSCSNLQSDYALTS